ncbi:CCR4-NOT transcription complex subunit 3-like isoform X1 [Biomphalaria glabrata]|uniref:CCR4-NOT transcription complex subunit 3 n=1 Tax=Biomphalaria glabrata TaxID=6526 RepID=A0A2C9JHP4_BIOGL|nr:CCR4-NOT transcription complex subunit 3-like isoform X1 [Biomphalaria glabrata]KAI8765497.1 CCR4-NOT transcription complex subunit 3-like isoform X1 [Biomphalaria glabrata]KAI8797478.1 CCR4-NOT transcription complex subunit 3 isoform X1 [Biomphalaria glabrata]
MADRRKLQGEIDRCLKKVDEGVETFEDIWKKVQAATNSNQKEKFETDLKKEIKKLQRLRDQIKSWIANSDIKDKSSLLDHRKLIETQMERFKVVERETKTKAYSKDGLGAAAKLDPQTKEKAETTQWISNVIESLNLQLDQFESELEAKGSSSKKKGKVGEDPRIDQLKQQQEKHKLHIETLEKIMRQVDNDKLAVEKIRDLRDDIEYYVESNQDPNFQENLYIYDDLDLEDIAPDVTAVASSPTEGDEFADKIMSTPSSTNSSSPSPSPSVNANHSNEKHDDVDRKRHKSQSEEKSASPAPSGTSKPPSLVKQHSQNNTNAQNSESNSVNSNHHPSTTPSPLTAYAVAAGGQQNSATGSRFSHPNPPSVWQRSLTAQTSFPSDTSKPYVNSVDHGSTGNLTSSVTSSSSTNTNSVSMTSSGNPSVPSAPSPQTVAVVAAPSLSTVNSLASSSINNSSQVHNSRTDSTPVMNGPISANGPTSQKIKNDELSLRTMAQQAVANAELEKTLPSTHAPVESSTVYNNSSQAPSQTLASLSEQCSVLSEQQLSSQLPQQQQIVQAPSTNTIHLNPLLGMAPLGPVQLAKEQHYQSAMVDAAYHHLPHPSDSERMRHFLPRNPCPTASYYPSTASPHADTVEFYQRCGTETLFFIFYYMEGTKAQYLAAKALKKQSWRFHTKYMMWFQRHEEPKQITEEFEQGTYIYFDYEKWGQKKKEGFTFEYRYLEDRDLN